MAQDFPDDAGPNFQLDKPWWRDREKPGRSMLAMLNSLKQRQAARRKLFLFHAQLYADLPTLGLGPYAYGLFDDMAESDSLRLNLVKAVVDTYVSTISQSNPKPMALSDNGGHSEKKKAKGITRWWEAKCEEAEWRSNVSNPCLRDSGCYGTGLVKVGIENEGDEERADVFAERVFPWEITVDDAEFQNPVWGRTIYHQKWYSRDQLYEMYPRKRREIRDTARYSGERDLDTWPSQYPLTTDLVCVTEGFHKKSGPKAQDGIRVLALPSGEVLGVERWNDDEFPIVALWRATPNVGYWGTSIPYELRGLQLSINETLEDIKEALRTVGRPKWMVSVGSDVLDDAIDDDIGTIMRYAGTTPPTVYTPQVIPPDAYKFLWDKWSKGFELIGFSQARSGGMLPPGLTGSGASIRAWNEVEGGRAYEASKLWEEWHVKWGKRSIDVARRVAKIRPDYASKLRSTKKGFAEVIRFADYDLDEYSVTLYPVSKLSMLPSQRLAQVDDWFAKGIIDMQEYRALLDFPDLQAEETLLNSPRVLTDKLIERYREADDPNKPNLFIYPEPEWDLEFMRARFQYASVLAFVEEDPEENQELLHRFIACIDRLLNQKADEEAAAMAASQPMGGPAILPPGDPTMGLPPGGAPMLPPGGGPPLPPGV